MSEEIELEPINAPVPKDATQAENAAEITDGEWWAWSTAAIFFLFSLPLLISPRLFLLLSTAEDEGRTALTPLEQYLATHLGIGLFGLSLSLLTAVPSPPLLDRDARNTQSPRHPLLYSTTISSILSSLISYNSVDIGSLGTFVSFVSGFVGLWGTYVILFGESSSISKTTGADKRTSRFLFGNKSAASVQKKAWKKAQKER